jgi:hypothetical protein
MMHASRIAKEVAMTTLNGGFEVASWDENAYDERGARRLTRAAVSQTFIGDIAGSGSAEWLMAYRQDGTARFVGLQLVEGEVAGRTGTFVLETSGDFDGQVARWDATVVAGSPTGELRDLVGRGKFEAPLGSKATYELRVKFGGKR